MHTHTYMHIRSIQRDRCTFLPLVKEHERFLLKNSSDTYWNHLNGMSNDMMHICKLFSKLEKREAGNED